LAHILVIDDDPQILEIFRKFLEIERHSVVTASNGEEGINIFRNNRTDLIVTDIVMPVKDGIKTIMQLEREFSDIKVIAISGGGVIEPDRYLALAKCIGVKQTLTKPVTKEQLINAVNKVLKIH
jgi:YesN/AraC family two-component response regulator